MKLRIRILSAAMLFAGAVTLLSFLTQIASPQSPNEKKLKNRPLVWNPPALNSPPAGVASSPSCDLNSVLAHAAQRTTAMVNNLQNFTAQEDISYRAQDLQTSAQQFGSEDYDYVVVFQQRGDKPIVDERRHAVHGTNSEIAAESRGIPEMALLFLPALQPDYEMKCRGQLSWEGQPAWLVEFRQRPDRASRTFGFSSLKGSFAVPLLGRAWIAADSGEILHLEAGMMHGLPAIKMSQLYFSVTYSPVRFQSRDVRVWLPHIADVYYDYGDLETIVHHTFSDFLLFSVDTDQKIAKPKPSDPPKL
ncbi:MAG TPA: hypothetical protein VJN93_06275 [Candidatus Acidoferrum sp.]|nr:hypothetical protein [Candidatus Acidoferrum sp.]